MYSCQEVKPHGGTPPNDFLVEKNIGPTDDTVKEILEWLNSFDENGYYYEAVISGNKICWNSCR
jgi:hypothetical protein